MLPHHHHHHHHHHIADDGAGTEDGKYMYMYMHMYIILMPLYYECIVYMRFPHAHTQCWCVGSYLCGRSTIVRNVHIAWSLAHRVHRHTVYTDYIQAQYEIDSDNRH